MFVQMCGNTLYEQATADYQFEVYYENLYEQFLGVQDNLGYQAVLDVLYFEIPMHNYLNFVAHDPERVGTDNKTQFVSRGNRFYNVLTHRVPSLALVPSEE